MISHLLFAHFSLNIWTDNHLSFQVEAHLVLFDYERVWLDWTAWTKFIMVRHCNVVDLNALLLYIYFKVWWTEWWENLLVLRRIQAKCNYYLIVRIIFSFDYWSSTYWRVWEILRLLLPNIVDNWLQWVQFVRLL